MPLSLAFSLCLGQFVCDQGFEPGIAGKAEDVVDAVNSHRAINSSRQPGSARSRFDVRATLPDLRDDKGDLFLATSRGVDVRGTQFRQSSSRPQKI